MVLPSTAGSMCREDRITNAFCSCKVFELGHSPHNKHFVPNGHLQNDARPLHMASLRGLESAVLGTLALACFSKHVLNGYLQDNARPLHVTTLRGLESGCARHADLSLLQQAPNRQSSQLPCKAKQVLRKL